ncbi:MAG: ATP-binding protein [SAR324 cluster bacterium]|nr:ATP-binding protein [SAR324 cluster bacterium]
MSTKANYFSLDSSEGFSVKNCLWVTGLYWLTAEVSIYLSFQNVNTAIVWPSAGVSFVAWFLYKKYIGPSIFIGSMAANFHFLSAYSLSLGDIILADFTISVGNVLAPWIGVTLWQKYRENSFLFGDHKEVLRFVFYGALPAAALASLSGSASIWFFASPKSKFLVDWFAWGISDLLGILLVAPLLFLILYSYLAIPRKSKPVEALIITICILYLGYYVFGPDIIEIKALTQPFLFIVPLLWGAVRFSMLSAQLWSTLAFVIVWISSSLKMGHFQLEGLSQPITTAQIFVILISMSTLLLSATIRQLRRLQFDLKESNEELEAKVLKRTQELSLSNQAKDQFISVISHDLRGPVGSLKMIFKDLWRSPQDVDGEVFHAVKETVKSTSDLLDNLLNWAKMQQGGVLIEPLYFDLKQVVETCFAVCRSQAEHKKILLENKSSKDIRAFADQSMITSVLTNLINNAIKFTREGGTIVVTLLEEEDFTIVKIKDNGVGMTERDRGQAFLPIEKRGPTFGTHGEVGSGLGLVICKEFVKQNGGKISVVSALGLGTEFTFSLPRGKA